MGSSPRQAQWGLRTGFEKGQLPLSSSVRENKLLYSSASNMMTVKHNKKSTNAKNDVKAAALALLAVVAMSTKSLMLGEIHA